MELKAKAENYLKQAVKTGPRYPESHYYYARWLYRNGRPVDAIYHLRKALDLAPAHVKSLAWMERQPDAPLLEILNVGTGRGTSVREALAAFERATGQAVEFKVGDRRDGDIEQIYANTDRAERVLGWKAERSIDDAMADAWRWQSGLSSR
jgi:UDP-glucose 4-epimerase